MIAADLDARPRAGAASGFTLLEVLIAVAIAALSLVGLFQIGGIGLFAADTAGRVEEATERAQSRLATFERSAQFAPGPITGDDGDGYRWQLRATPIARHPVDSTQRPAAVALYDLEVTVSWRERGRLRSVLLQTRRLGLAPAGE